MLVGALVGAACGASRIPASLTKGLKGSAGIRHDIGAFVAAVHPRPSGSGRSSSPHKPKARRKVKDAQASEKPAEAEAPKTTSNDLHPCDEHLKDQPGGSPENVGERLSRREAPKLASSRSSSPCKPKRKSTAAQACRARAEVSASAPTVGDPRGEQLPIPLDGCRNDEDEGVEELPLQRDASDLVPPVSQLPLSVCATRKSL
eukprot:gnl/TRDRNA2_/TRDRNA2_27880_c0_seq1.p1 gnl/TRDRNA2_/TRDRNA2_27880_c0~~gnl/TRDRNA2_/TRDRNA2_27880_c0_seq1.p1  ORF type:complete len:203 (+),score=36.41 gnl/TRDRNA2_/TRDRNA2_27880_c0_seq1:318-926(+)